MAVPRTELLGSRSHYSGHLGGNDVFTIELPGPTVVDEGASIDFRFDLSSVHFFASDQTRLHEHRSQPPQPGERHRASQLGAAAFPAFMFSLDAADCGIAGRLCRRRNVAATLSPRHQCVIGWRPPGSRHMRGWQCQQRQRLG
jgi:hypothetical protein